MQWQGAINKLIPQQLIGLQLIIAAAIIAAVRLAREDISKSSPRLTFVVIDCIGVTLHSIPGIC
jgi:hypothetical protein